MIKSPQDINHRGSLISLIAILALVCASVTAVTIALLYDAAFEQKRLDLHDAVEVQARLIEAIAEFDAKYRVYDNPDGARGATLEQVLIAHKKFDILGSFSEVTLAERDGDMIKYLFVHHHRIFEGPLKRIPIDSDLSEAMRRALYGQSGTVVGLDYNGTMVIAAYESIANLDIGIVVKYDLSEVRAPYIQAGLIAAGLCFIMVCIGSVLLIRVRNPLVRMMQLTEDRFNAAVQKANDAVTIASLAF